MIAISAIAQEAAVNNPAIDSVMEKSADNHPELQKVLKHYGRQDDSLKLLAAEFLISNMEGHSYVTYKLVDSVETEIPYDNRVFPTYDALLANWNTLEDAHPGLDFKKNEIIEDTKTIKADFLIKQIDHAFKAWQEQPWARWLSFQDFCEYVLPYRGSNEPLEDWRQYFYEKYNDIEKKMANPSDPIEAAKLINADVMTYFTFDPRYYYHPTDQGLSEMLANHLGRCEDMTNIAIYAMRANGLGVTSDYTPFWANSGNNHAWNAILTPDGKVVPFMGAEANPGEYQLWNKLAKVYRKMYSKQPDNLIFQKRKQEKVPPWLAGKSYIDVTKDYVPTNDVTIRLEAQIPDSVDIAYICVFNSGEWQAIHWGRIIDGGVTFTAMGTGIAYLPAFYLNEKIVPAGPPFILGDDNSIATVKPKSEEKSSIKLLSTTAKKLEISTDGIEKVSFNPGTEYELFCWNGEWQSLGSIISEDKPLIFNEVPSGSLYWLVAKNSDREERIFTIENGSQVWW